MFWLGRKNGVGGVNVIRQVFSCIMEEHVLYFSLQEKYYS